MRLAALSSLASSFPSVEVEYEDLLEHPYQRDGRGSGGIDCLGIVLEVYRRAGILLPDPSIGALDAFMEIFEPIPEADQLYDLVHLRRGAGHLYVVIRPGLVLTAREKVGVQVQRLKNLVGHPQVEFYRVRAANLPE